MASYRHIEAATLLSGGAMTGTSVLTSKAIDCRTLPLVGFSISWTGTPNGTFIVQGSLDGTTFVDMGITVAPAAGAVGNRGVDIGPTAFNYIQVQYTNTSGTGTLTIVGAAKSGG